MKNKTQTFILILVSCMAFLWIVIAKLFSIFSYISFQYFALDKVNGHFFSLPIQVTLLSFILLLILFSLLLYFLAKKEDLSLLTLILLLIAGMICLIAATLTYPVGALDLFNYVLMGKLLVFYRQNPFLIPFDMVGSADLLHAYAIFLNVTTGYGPLWLMLTGFASLLSGTSSLLSMVLGYKDMTALFYVLTGFILYHVAEGKEKLVTVASYLLNPFILFEGVVNAHNDILVSFFLLLGWLAFKKKHTSLFICLFLAGLIKLYALTLIPLMILFLIKEKWSKKAIGISLVGGIIVSVFVYLPFWENGRLLGGVLEGLQNAQLINGYSPYSLAREFFITLYHSPTALILTQYFFMGVFLLTLVVVIASSRKTKAYLASCICLLVAFLLMITIYQPWYAIPVLGFMSLSTKLRDRIFLLLISAGGLLSYPLSVWVWFHSGWSILTIHLFLASFIALPPVLYLGVLLKSLMTSHNTVQD